MESPTNTRPQKRVQFDKKKEEQDTKDLQPLKLAISIVQTGLVLLLKTYKLSQTKLGIDYV